MVAQCAQIPGKKHKAMVVLGDLGDINAIGRRDGFEAAVKGNEDRGRGRGARASEWNQEKAQAGVVERAASEPGHQLYLHVVGLSFPSIVSRFEGRWEIQEDRRERVM
jgi:hypothetical protein